MAERTTSGPPQSRSFHQARAVNDRSVSAFGRRDQFGKLTLRYASRLHHLGIGITHAGTPVLILVASHTITVISKTGNHVLSSHRIDPDRNYWRNQNKNPGRWPGNL